MLVVWKLDRLGRNLRHLVNTMQDLSALRRSRPCADILGRDCELEPAPHVTGVQHQRSASTDERTSRLNFW